MGPTVLSSLSLSSLYLSGVTDLGCSVGNLPQTKRITSQIWVVICHQYRISTLLPQMLFCGTSKCQLVSLANKNTAQWNPVVEMLKLTLSLTVRTNKCQGTICKLKTKT